jgi:hypothetical protein
MKKLLLMSIILFALAFCQDTIEVEFDSRGVALQDVDFRKVPINRSGEYPVYLTNAGNMMLYIHDVKLLSGDIFTLQIAGVDSLQAGERDSLMIGFNPLERGTYLDTLMITSNDTDLDTAYLPILGIGGKNKIEVFIPKKPRIF